MSEIQANPPLDQSSEPVNELFEELPSFIARGLVYILLALLAAALIYSTVGKVDDLVTAQAIMTPSGQVRQLQSTAGGRVTRVAVQEGEAVVRDQALIYLDTEAAQAQMERARQERDARRQQLTDLLAARADAVQISETRARLAQAEAELSAARRAMDASVVVAPMDGQVTRLAVRGPGESVQPGQTVAEVAPAGAPLVFEARVPTSGIGDVAVGQTARLKVDAYPHQEYGTVDGRVTFISPDAQADGSGVPAYRVTIAPVERAQPGKKPIPLRLGLTGTAEIVTERKRIIDLFVRKMRGDG